MQTFNLVAYAYGIDLPDEVYDSPEFTRLRELSSDIIVLATDVVSYIKEQTEGLNNNVISICRMKGMSAQEAHDYIGELIKEKYQEWHTARARIPIMGEAMDFEVGRYIQGMINCHLASSHSV
jgi:Terpene synthase family 2, C-terminal metal binding